MSAHADKTLHKKIYNINDTDTFPPYPFFKNVIFAINSWRNFSGISCMNSSTKFVRIHANSYDLFARKIGYVMNGLYCIGNHYLPSRIQYAVLEIQLFEPNKF